MDQPMWELIMMASEHWEKWLPRKTKELKDAGQFYAALQIVAVYTLADIDELLEKGYANHEAKELVLPLYILLEPESETHCEHSPIQKEQFYHPACASGYGSRPLRRR